MRSDRRSRLAALGCVAAVALAAVGCGEINTTVVDTQEKILSRHQKVQVGSSVRVRSRLDGTTLILQTYQGCDLIEEEEVQRHEETEADEDLTEEFVALGLSTVPLVSGIVMLVDAPNVHDTDRNAREYNAIGQEGAYIGGTALTVAGGLIALVPIVELLRVAAAGDETTTTFTRQGNVLQHNVPCDTGLRPTSAQVSLVVAGQTVFNDNTNGNGHLEIDLAASIPRDLAKRAVSIEVLVAGQVVGELDIAPVLDAQRELDRKRESETWQQLDREGCRRAPPDDPNACAMVESYLAEFPDGLHANEARQLLTQRQQHGPVIATDEPPEEIDPAMQQVVDQAAEQLKKDQAEACKKTCLKTCAKSEKPGKRAVACVDTCQKELCQ
jgi:hypothetical protein